MTAKCFVFWQQTQTEVCWCCCFFVHKMQRLFYRGANCTVVQQSEVFIGDKHQFVISFVSRSGFKTINKRLWLALLPVYSLADEAGVVLSIVCPYVCLSVCSHITKQASHGMSCISWHLGGMVQWIIVCGGRISRVIVWVGTECPDPRAQLEVSTCSGCDLNHPG